VSKIYSPNELGKSNYRCEYLVIGSGAGGSVAALELAEAGKNVLVIEEGFHLRTESFTSDISKMMNRGWRKNGITPFWGKPPIGFAEGMCVGGGTVINGGLLWRTPERILDIWQKSYGVKEGYTYQDLLPHFKKIENLLEVGFHQIDSDNVDSDVLKNGCDLLDWKYVPVPRAGGESCVNANLCPTGCPTGAKKSTALTYIPKAMESGALLFSGCKAERIVHNGNKASAVIASLNSSRSRKQVKIYADYIFLAGGAIQTPYLLQNSKLAPNAGKKLEFHFNLKFVAEFDKTINAQKGTMFTYQVQEFMDSGLLIMASNYQPHYLAMTLSHFGNEIINDVMDKYANCGLYVAQIQPESKGRVISALKGSSFVTYKFDINDLKKIRDSIIKTSRLLFEAGAKKVYLPVVGTSPIIDNGMLENAVNSLTPGNIEIVSVHAMASCPMGDRGEAVVGFDGKVHGIENLFITDASILPTNIGESPQGTIMALSHGILQRHINK